MSPSCQILISLNRVMIHLFTRFFLHLVKDTLLELPLNLLPLLVGDRLAVESHESTQVELGLLEKLDLADVNLWESTC